MTHDLVRLGIANQNMTPNSPSLDARPLFQAALQYVQQHPVSTITVDTGSYYLLTSQQSNAVLVFPQLSNVVIDLGGSTFYFNTPLLSSGFLLYFCTHVTFTNFQTDYITPPYTHVQISSVDTANRVIHYQLIPGWPDPSTFNNLIDPYGGVVQYWGALFRDGEIIPGTTRTALVPPFQGSTLVLKQDYTPWTQASTLSTLAAGDVVVVTARAGGQPVIIQHGDSITLSNARIYGSNSFAVLLSETSNSLVDHVSVMPRPVGGLVGSNADGIHFSSTYQNNHIRNCYVTRTMDDALIMDSMLQATIVSVDGPRQLTVQRSAFDNFPNGTAVNFVDAASTNEFTGATIVSQTPPDSRAPGFGERVVLTFDQDLPPLTAGQFMMYGSADLRGAGSTFEDNTVEDIIVGKGLWINGLMNVTVQRNVIRRTSESGISITEDTKAFPSPPSHNLTITDNVLEGTVGPMAPGNGVQDSLGAVEVISTNDHFSFATTSPNSNITIANNYISDSGRSGIWVGELNGGTLQNNLVIRSSQNPTQGGTYGIPTTQEANQVVQDALTPVVIRYSSAVAEVGDTINADSDITSPVLMIPQNTTVPASGSSGSFQLTTAISDFNWEASTAVNWISILAPASGQGSGVVSFSVSPNPDTKPRSGVITVAGETFTITQAANPAFNLSDLGATSFMSDGIGGAVSGYARILATTGSTPTGFAILDERIGGTLVSEAGVPASFPLKNGRIYAEISAGGWNGPGTDIGVAMTNSTNTDATINFSFTKSDGTDIPGGTYILKAGTQNAAYLDQAPWNGPLNFTGTFTFTSNVAVSVVALQLFNNERSEPLITTLPVVNTDLPISSSQALVPYYADGLGFTTSILLVNPTDAPMNGSIQFRFKDGNPEPLSVNGTTASSFPYTIARRSSFKLTTDGLSNTVVTGSVTIVPAAGSNTPTPLVDFSFRNGAGTMITQAGVPSNLSTAFRLFVEVTPGQATSTMGSYSTGFAIANTSPAPTKVSLDLFSVSGAPVASTSLSLPGSGVQAMFFEDPMAFPNVPLVPSPFQGILRISTTSTNISVVGLRIRWNERPGEFLMTTTPPSDETAPATKAEADFPQIVNGGGFTTEFVLFSGSAGQTAAGSLQFVQPDGTNFKLNLN